MKTRLLLIRRMITEIVGRVLTRQVGLKADLRSCSIRAGSIGLIALAIGACSSVPPVNSALEDFRQKPALAVTSGVQIGPEAAVGAAGALLFGVPSNMLGVPTGIFSNANAALLYVIYDPFAPNWKITEKPLSETVFYLNLQAKSFRVGGDGESLQIVKRRASQLQHQKAYASYRILDYSESVESSTPFTHRVSEATIELVQAPTR